MKITEISTTHAFKHLHPDLAPKTLSQVLKTHGWHLLGTGMEAAVAEHPNKLYALKIYPAISKYSKFVDFVQEHPFSPHFPRFSRYERHIPGTEYNYVRMEKLEHISGELLLKTKMNYLLNMLEVCRHSQVRPLSSDFLDYMQHEWEKRGLDLDTVDYSSQEYQYWGGHPPQSWHKAIQALLSHSIQIGENFWDMHDGNFMLRNNTLVILDPYY